MVRHWCLKKNNQSLLNGAVILLIKPHLFFNLFRNRNTNVYETVFEIYFLFDILFSICASM